MNITSYQNNTNYAQKQKFTGVHLVQVAKEAFKNPNDIKDCSDTFGTILGMLKGPNLKFFLEQPNYLAIINELKQRNTTLSWLKQNAGIDVPEPIFNNYHSFWVFTKEHMKQADKATNFISRTIIWTKLQFSRGKNSACDAVFCNAELMKKFDPILDQAKHHHTANTLEDLVYISRDIDC